MNVLTLHDPFFWQTLFNKLPCASDVEEYALPAAAAAAGVSYAYAMARLQDYLHGRLKKQRDDFIINPFAPSPYWHRGNTTVH
jgi:hypothetical protein